MQIKQSNLLIDTCCLLNFCTSGELFSILQIIPVQTIIVEEVKKELKKEENIEQIENAIKQGLLLIVDFESEVEEEAFVNYAVNLGDGESATASIAINRGWAMATDDKKAIKILSQESPSLKIVSTPDIIKYWSETVNIDQFQLSNILNKIKLQARYIPPKNHPLKNWWETAINF